MSVMRTENFGHYVHYDTMPKWMEIERYEYCEEFVESADASKHSSVFSALMTVLHSIF